MSTLLPRSEDSPRPLVTIVVPTFNRRSSLERLLSALAGQMQRAESFEVIVVDDGSSDGTVDWARRYSTSYSLTVLAQSHLGPAAARNLGVLHARGELVLFLDDDVVPRPNLVEAHIAAHSGDPGVVVIGRMSPPGDWPRSAWVRWEEDLLAVQYAEMLTQRYPPTPRQFYTANASLNRELFRQVGGFDPAFKRAEDVEFAYRLRARGARFAFEPNADVQHYAQRSFRAWCDASYQYGRYDVVMHRDKRHATIPNAGYEFHRRHAFTRGLVHFAAGHPERVRLSVVVLSVVTRFASLAGQKRISNLALSAIANLLYWQGVCEELGSRGKLWQAVASGVHIPLG